VDNDTDLARKRRVWQAMSELFLDTELDDAQCRSIAARLAVSGYGVDELRAIMEEDVAPALASNLVDIAGEWAGWSEAEVAEAVARSKIGLRWPKRLRVRWVRARYTDDWNRVLGCLTA